MKSRWRTPIHACICYAEPYCLVASQLIVQHQRAVSAADRAVVGIDSVCVDRQLHRINKIAGGLVDRIDQCDRADRWDRSVPLPAHRSSVC